MSATLEKRINFTPDDLKANRNGNLSPRQMRRMTIGAWVGAAFIVASGVFAAYLIIMTAGPPLTVQTGTLTTLIVVGGVGLAIYTFRAQRANVQANEVQAVTGEAAIEYRSVMRAGSYILIIDEVEFLITEPVSDVIEEGARYTVYHLPNERRVISAERMSP